MKNTGKWLNRLQNQTRSGNIHGKVTKQTVTKDIITSMIHSLLFKSYNLVQYVQNKHKCGQQLFRIYSSLYIFKRKKYKERKYIILLDELKKNRTFSLVLYQGHSRKNNGRIFILFLVIHIFLVCNIISCSICDQSTVLVLCYVFKY